jgi:hypothetical protein
LLPPPPPDDDDDDDDDDDEESAADDPDNSMEGINPARPDSMRLLVSTNCRRTVHNSDSSFSTCIKAVPVFFSSCMRVRKIASMTKVLLAAAAKDMVSSRRIFELSVERHSRNDSSLDTARCASCIKSS